MVLQGHFTIPLLLEGIEILLLMLVGEILLASILILQIILLTVSRGRFYNTYIFSSNYNNLRATVGLAVALGSIFVLAWSFGRLQPSGGVIFIFNNVSLVSGKLILVCISVICIARVVFAILLVLYLKYQHHLGVLVGIFHLIRNKSSWGRS